MTLTSPGVLRGPAVSSRVQSLILRIEVQSDLRSASKSLQLTLAANCGVVRVRFTPSYGLRYIATNETARKGKALSRNAANSWEAVGPPPRRDRDVQRSPVCDYELCAIVARRPHSTPQTTLYTHEGPVHHPCAPATHTRLCHRNHTHITHTTLGSDTSAHSPSADQLHSTCVKALCVELGSHNAG